MNRFIPLLLLLIPLTAWAGPFDGTWKMSKDSMQVKGKPNVYLLQNGTYTCAVCAPEVRVAADGAPHKVKGHAYFDHVSVTIVNPQTIRVVSNLAGKKTIDRTLTVGADDKSLTEDLTDFTGSKPATARFAYRRVAAAPAGAHAISGSWEPDVSNMSLSAEISTVTFQQTADGIRMSQPTGQSYDAHFDGKEYLVENDSGKTMVVLKKLATNKLEETDRRLGKVTDVITMEVSVDGRNLHVVDEDRLGSQTITYTAEKQ